MSEGVVVAFAKDDDAVVDVVRKLNVPIRAAIASIIPLTKSNGAEDDAVTTVLVALTPRSFVPIALMSMPI